MTQNLTFFHCLLAVASYVCSPVDWPLRLKIAVNLQSKCSLVPRLPVFFANGGTKDKLDNVQLKKLGAWYLKFSSRDLQR